MSKTIVVVLSLCWLIGLAAALPSRQMEPVIITGAELAPFLGDDPIWLRVAVYNAALKSWTVVPFQVDERDQDGNYFHANGVLDPQDELVVMLRDLGDRAAVTLKPADPALASRARVEIAVTDPLTAIKRYAYVFWSDQLALSPISYVRHGWQGSTDVVYGKSYVIGHDPNQASGLPTAVLIPKSLGGDSLDFYKNQRFRLELQMTAYDTKDQIPNIDKLMIDNIPLKERMVNYDIKYSFLKVATINVSQEKAPAVTVGPVRIVRGNSLLVSLSSAYFETKDQTLPWPTYFYYDHFYEIPYRYNFTDLLDQLSTAELDVKIKRITFSQILDANGKNTIYYSKEDDPTNPVRVNDTFHQIGGYNLSSATWPGWHWYALVADPAQSKVKTASLFTILELRKQPVGSSQAVFLDEYDDSDGTRLYGNSGLRILGAEPDYISGYLDFDLTFKNYVFAENHDAYELAGKFDTLSVPLQLATLEQDKVPPARIDDLVAFANPDGSITLQWTAPGDDGQVGGPVDTLVVGYDTIPYIADEDDVNFWWYRATKLVKVPSPAMPGEQQSVLISGLDFFKTYYFGILSRDNKRNVSATAFVSGSTTPVELAAFTAQPQRDEIVLTWKTASESNNLGFAIDRRRAPQSGWNAVGFVDGRGTTQEPSEYQFIDQPPGFGEWGYRLRQIDIDGSETIYDEISVQLAAPSRFELAQNYPNPFNPSTTITWQLPGDVSGRVILVIYDLLGREICTLRNETAQPGYFSAIWDGRDMRGEPVGSGLYFSVLQAGSYRATRKMIKLD